MQRATPSVRSIDASGGPARCQIDTIVRLQAAVWDDEARVGYTRTIRLDLALGIRAIFSSRGRDNFLPRRSEQKREHQPGPNGIHAGSLRHPIACRTGRLAWRAHRQDRQRRTGASAGR